MDQKQVVKYIIGYLITICAILGLNNNMYSFRTKKFYVNYCFVAWSITSMLIFAWLYMKKLYCDIITEEFDMKNAVSLFYYMNVISAFLNYLSQIVVSKAYSDFFNRSRVFEAMDYLSVDTKRFHSQIILVITKIVIYPFVSEITLILRHMREDEDDKSLLWTFYTLYPLILSNVIPNCFFSLMILCRQGILALNNDLQDVVRKANFIQNPEQIRLHKHFYRMHRFCNLADELDELLQMYAMICYSTMTYIRLAAVPLLASLMCNLFAITAGFFRQYYSLADTLINEESYDIFNALTNGIFLLISLLEVALHSFVAGQNIEAIQETGIILRGIKLDHVDVRFRQSVEKFFYEILVINFKIQPLGLIEINFGLLHDVLSAVTSFLLILIQTDLTLRFSLK